VELPIFPLNTVLFPGATMPLHIFEERYKQMINECVDQQRPFGVILIRSGAEVGGAADPFELGTTAHIQQVERLEDGKMNVICAGGRRFRLIETLHDAPYLRGRVELIEPPHAFDDDTVNLASEAGSLFGEYVRLYLAVTNQWSRSMSFPDDPGVLSDFIGSRLPVAANVKQQLLEELSPRNRLAAETELLGEAIRELSTQVDAARTTRWHGFAVMN